MPELYQKIAPNLNEPLVCMSVRSGRRGHTYMVLRHTQQNCERRSGGLNGSPAVNSIVLRFPNE
jgi:hypothetical protein